MDYAKNITVREIQNLIKEAVKEGMKDYHASIEQSNKHKDALEEIAYEVGCLVTTVHKYLKEKQ